MLVPDFGDNETLAFTVISFVVVLPFLEPFPMSLWTPPGVVGMAISSVAAPFVLVTTDANDVVFTLSQ